MFSEAINPTVGPTGWREISTDDNGVCGGSVHGWVSAHVCGIAYACHSHSVCVLGGWGLGLERGWARVLSSLDLRRYALLIGCDKVKHSNEVWTIGNWPFKIHKDLKNLLNKIKSDHNY